MSKPNFYRIVTAKQAKAAAQRLINAAFHNLETGEHPHFHIPVTPMDDDVVITDYILQHEKNDE